MATRNLGHTLVIANPVAHSGKGAQATQLVRRFFESFSNATTSFDLETTRSMNDAVEIAAHAGGMDTVIALGGDGIIHEVVNGLMAIPNLIALIALSGVVVAETEHYLEKQGTVGAEEVVQD